MDDRKRQIVDLERQKKEQTVLLDSVLTRLGESLFGRMSDSVLEDYTDGNSLFGEWAVFKRLQNDIDGSQASIQAVEEQVRKFKELEEKISAKEKEDGACSREITVACGRLGKLLLDSSPADGDFCAPYRSQADALITKILSLEDRLAALEQRDGGNVFTWIGKNAQSLVLRSFLTKAQENLEQLRRNVGDRYTRQENALIEARKTEPQVAEIYNLCSGIEQKRAESRALSEELADLKEEKRRISSNFNSDGGPHKQIQSLKNHIARLRDELKTLYRRIGAETASIEFLTPENLAGSHPGGYDPGQRRQLLDSLIAPDDGEMLNNVARINESIVKAGAAIERLMASLAIDEEKAKIEKYRKMIQDKKEKIVQAEKCIAEYENNIGDAEENIRKLEPLAKLF